MMKMKRMLISMKSKCQLILIIKLKWKMGQNYKIIKRRKSVVTLECYIIFKCKLNKNFKF